MKRKAMAITLTAASLPVLQQFQHGLKMQPLTKVKF